MRRKLEVLLLAAVALFSAAGCIIIEDEELERGYVLCGDGDEEIICQPGTYCSSPLLRICHEGCVSDANCLEHERCLKEEEGDRTGTCVREERDPCCR